MTEPDPVNHPPHYTVGGIETIDFIEAKQLPYHLGNVIKYVTRAQHKGSELADLKKAAWYLNRHIEQREAALSRVMAVPPHQFLPAWSNPLVCSLCNTDHTAVGGAR